MALAILSGSVTAANMSSGATVTTSYVNSAACVMVMAVNTWGAGGYCPVTSITDSSGVVWKRRRQIQFTSPSYNISTIDHITQEIWWANVTATHGSAVTVTVNLANTASFEGTSAQSVIFGVTGSLVPATPWDINGSASQSATYSNASTDTAPTVGYANSSSAAMVLSFLSEMTSAALPGTQGTGYTLIGQNNIGASNRFSCAAEFKLASGAGSGSATWTSAGGRAWIALSDALTSDSSGTASSVGSAGLTIHGLPVNAHDSTGTASSIAGTISTTEPCVILAVVNVYSFTPAAAIRTVTGISGGGLTWTKRSSTAGQSGTSFSLNQEVWWANATGALTAQTITATLSGASSHSIDLELIAVSGSPTPATPWDTNASLPAKTSHMSGLASMSQAGTTSSTLSLMLAFADYAWNNHTASTTPTGFIDIAAPVINTGLNCFFEYQALAAPGSKTATWGNSQEFFQLTVDALNGDAATATTGTIATNLTKPSQSAAGAEKFTGTVVTHLTKPSQSLVAAETGVGTITTNLTKISQSLAGTEKFTGTISTHLSKASFSATGFESLLGTITTNLQKASIAVNAAEQFPGTISTNLNGVTISGTIASERFLGSIQSALSRINQAASGDVSGGPNGVIVTALRGVSQTLISPANVTATVNTNLQGIHQRATAEEIISGSIVTNVDTNAAFAIEALTYELFVGDIVTRLGPANFALSAEERMTGQINTRLGSITGQIVANLIEGAIIIEGPIETNLYRFGQSILGAKLGTPGAGKWYSYRYPDS